jgi:hypothetical protein
MEHTYYHVDRAENLKKGDVIGYIEGLDVASENISEIYSEGLTRHGVNHLKESQSGPTVAEWVLEFVRLIQFPEIPSRFQSVFAFETIESAERFLNESSATIPDDVDPVVWKVEAESKYGFKGDMNALPGEIPQFEIGVAYADRYWSGDPGSENPLWEVYLEPPVRVAERVDLQKGAP